MRAKIVPGAELEVLTPGEAAELLAAQYREDVEERVRAAATVTLDGAGNGEDEVYTPPLGMEFEARRISCDLSTATDPGTGQVALGAGKTVEYLRGVGGTRIEWGQPTFGAAVQVPGSQSWGDEQGPYIRNGETFAVRAKGLTAGATLDVTVEGILRKPARAPDRRPGIAPVRDGHGHAPALAKPPRPADRPPA